jgi:hypothetical protein
MRRIENGTPVHNRCKTTKKLRQRQLYPDYADAKPTADEVAMANNRSNSLVEDFLESKRVDHIADYVQRGRRYGSLNDGDLMAKWLASLKSMADAPREPMFSAAFEDAEAELALRKIDPRCDEAAVYFDRYMEATEADMREIKSDPKRLADLRCSLIDDLRAFSEARDWSN